MPENNEDTASTSPRLSTAELAGATPRGDQVNLADQSASHGDMEPALFPDAEARSMQARWHEVQASFVDEPRRAVEQADELVAAAMQRLAETFADERSRLETQWDRGDDVSTEDLRIALQRYRAFFGRLLSI